MPGERWGQTTFPGRKQVGCVAKTHGDAEAVRHRKLDAPTGYRLTPLPCGGPARLDPSLELNQGDPPCSSPPWPPGPRQGWAACSDRFWRLELRVFSTNLNILRAICSGHGYPPQPAVNTSRPCSDRFRLLELRVARTGTKPLCGGKDEGPARRRWTSATHATHTTKTVIAWA